LSVGITLLLGAIGRVCMPTSKRGWWNWARTTSCEYLLRCALGRVDSQHFWDLMDALPIEAIPKIETEILQKVQEHYCLEEGTLLFDTTNFFTFINTTNDRCSIAQRGKNKQKRTDLRQVGLAMVVTRKDSIPIFHQTYQGNLCDAVVFRDVIGSIKERMIALGLDMGKHTLVFDRGNNSKKNMALVEEMGLHYVGALTPYHHQALVDEADGNYNSITVKGEPLDIYRVKKQIWGQERTVLIFVSEHLKAGQLRGIYQSLKKKEKQIRNIQKALLTPRGACSNKEKLQERIAAVAKGQFLEGILQWTLTKGDNGNYQLEFMIDKNKLDAIEESLGFRILMTDRHDWQSADIVEAYYGQAAVEGAFKNIKNPYHLALTPQHHWTDQKIIVHNFMCVLGYLLSSILWKEAREKGGFSGTLDTLLSTLNNIRLAALIEQDKGSGHLRTTYQIEEMSKEESNLVETLGLGESHRKRPKFKGVGVYI